MESRTATGRGGPALRHGVAIVLSTLLLAQSMGGAFAATIATDLWIYQDGDTVTVSGVEFAPLELVDLVTTDPVGTVVNEGTVQTDEAGSLVYPFVLHATVGGIYDVVATGRDSGLVAATQFDPPTSTVTFPATSSRVTAAAWATGCSAVSIVGICGTAVDVANGISRVDISLKAPGAAGKWWDGSSFASASVVFSLAFSANQAPTSASWQYVLAASALTALGTYTLNLKVTDGRSGNNKTVVTTSGSFTFVRSVSATVTVDSKAYDGTTSVTGTSCVLSGVLPADVAAVGCVATGVTFVGAAVGTRQLAVTTTSLTGTAAANYELTGPATGTGTVTARALTPIVTVAGKTYDGTTSVSGATCALDLVVSGDSVTCSGTTSFAAPTVGAHTVTTSGITLGGASVGNYSLTTSSATTTASISAAPLTASVTVNDKQYDGSAAATIAGCDLLGVIAGESVTCSADTASAVFASVAPGATSVSVSGLTLSGATATNYAFDGTSTTSATILARDLIARITVDSRPYNGTTAAAISGCVLEGEILVAGSVACDVSGASVSFADAAVGTHQLVISGVGLSGAAAEGYSLAATGTGTITQASLGVASVTVARRVYDGMTDASITACSLSGVVDGDDVTCDVSGASATFGSALPGTHAVTVIGLSIAGSASSNYTFDGVATGSATIDPAPVTASVTVDGKLWDGTTSASLATCSLGGVVGDDDVTCSMAGASVEFVTAEPGDAVAVVASGLALVGAHAARYSFDGTGEGTGSIQARMLTATVTIAPKTYDGTPVATIEGCQLSADIPGVACAIDGATAAFASSAAGAHTVLVTGLGLAGQAASAFVLASDIAAATAVISPASIRAHAVSVRGKAYDGTPVASVESCALIGRMGTDDVACGTGGASGAFATTAVGLHDVDVDGLALVGADAGNYELETRRALGRASISPKALGAVVTLAPKTYDGTTTAVVASCSLVGVVAGEDVACESAGATATLADANAGDRGFTVTGLALRGPVLTNYAFAGVSSGTTRIAGVPVIVEVSGGSVSLGTATAASEIRFSARMRATAGDLRSASTSVKLAPVGPGGSIDSSCDRTVGEAEVVFDCRALNVPVGTYEIVAQASGNYEGVGYDAYTVFESASGHTSGGGHFFLGGDKVNFGFTMKYNRSGSQVQGNVILVRHFPDGTVARLKSNSLGTLGTTTTATKGTASFTGKSVYASMVGGAWVSTGNNAFTVYVEDLNQPGTGIDRIWISAPGWFRFPNSTTLELAGGNIVVPHGKR